VRVNEADLLGELREAWVEYQPVHAAIEAENAAFHPISPPSTSAAPA